MNNVPEEKTEFASLPVASEPVAENGAPVPTMTKGEAILSGLGMVADGLKLMGTAGSKYDLVREITGSNASAQRLRDIVKGDRFFYSLVVSMVKSKNPKLSPSTVEKVVDDFLGTLLDLSQPYRST